jgi:uncharacterized BrkB/YihY/UPF0761 family membrane protein
VNALYGAFTGAIILVGWIWLTNVAMLFGAELNAAIERERDAACVRSDTHAALRSFLGLMAAKPRISRASPT